MSTAIEIRERPILMHARSIRGILDGRKVQTRRIVKNPDDGVTTCVQPNDTPPLLQCDKYGAWSPRVCPHGQPGDRLWVRETWREKPWTTDRVHPDVAYRADQSPANTLNAAVLQKLLPKWRPSIFMPRWACRLILEITDIRVERVQDISEEDARAEGLRSTTGDGGGPGCGFKWKGVGYEGSTPDSYHAPYRSESDFCCCNVGRSRLKPAICAFGELWNDTNGKGAWDRNDWCWVISFKRVTE